jgi:FtsP/CotA-like multicopper oxidase with cupredoxin domain
VIVHFTNHLPEETTIHWHGVRVSNSVDGVPGKTQAAVPAGGAFDYSFIVTDASLFWYHPHFRSAAQLGDGLYGALLVEDPAELPGVQLGDPLVLVLSDMSLDPGGALSDPNGGGDFGTLFGREGDLLLVNGKVLPTVRARAGLRQRWRIVNAARSRYFQLGMAGHTFTRVGGDGGLIPAPVETQQLLLVPGARMDVVVTPTGSPGTTVPLRWTAFDRGFGSAFERSDVDLLNLQLTTDAPVTEATVLPTTLRTVVPLDTSAALPRTLDLTQDYLGGQLTLGVNGVPYRDTQPMQAHLGDTFIWTVNNLMAWDHPLHVHGFFFQALDPDSGAALPVTEWLDTYNVPKNGTVRLAVKYDDRPGMWMFHCHVLDHSEAGMAGMVQLDP